MRVKVTVWCQAMDLPSDGATPFPTEMELLTAITSEYLLTVDLLIVYKCTPPKTGGASKESSFLFHT